MTWECLNCGAKVPAGTDMSRCCNQHAEALCACRRIVSREEVQAGQTQCWQCRGEKSVTEAA